MSGSGMRADQGLDRATLQQIAKEMQGDGVWVAPSYADQHAITPAQERHLEQAVAATSGQGARPVRVILVDVPERDFGLIPDQLASWIRDEAGVDALYLVPSNGGELSVSNLFDSDTRWNDYEAARIAADEHPDQVVDQVVLTSQVLQLSTDQIDARYEQVDRTECCAPDPQDDGGTSGWAVGGLVLVGVLVLVGARAAWRRWRRRNTRFEITPTVQRHVMAAELHRLRQEAERETQALAEAVAEAPGSLVDRSAWPAVLAHLVAARTALAEGTGVADAAGALVLARRGESARAAAQADHDWVPSPVCWFHPAHGWATHEAESPAGARVRCCRRCSQRGETREVLLVPARGTVVAWYDADLGVWTRTGFGATDPDLPASVERAFED